MIKGWTKEKIRTLICIFILGLLLDSFNLVSAATLSPHRPSQDLARVDCRKCHEKKPDLSGSATLEEIRRVLRPDYDLACLGCHADQILQSCQLASSKEVSVFLVNQMSPFPLPLFKDQISCFSCHKVHQLPKDKDKNGQAGQDVPVSQDKPTNQDELKKELVVSPNLLREDYVKFRALSEKINPHQAKIFCFLCHEQEPKPNNPNLYLKSADDKVGLCKGCHNNQRAKADNHPVNIIPSQSGRVKIPEQFPLQNGKVTCLTCHQLSCKEKDKNLFFLRGGPYQRRIDTCLACHIKEQFVKDNPHDQVTETGEIKDDRCLFCHEINKENTNGLAFKFKASFKFYCLGCHPIEIETHPFGAYHTGRQLHSIWGNLKPSERVELSQQEKFKMFPLTIGGQIMCTTCHNPHDVRKGPKLRINDVNKSCRQCHYKKYGQIVASDKPYGQSWLSAKGSGEVLPVVNETPVEDDLAPAQEDKVPFGYRASLQYYCIGCHANKETNHPYGIVHTGKFIKQFWRSRYPGKGDLCDIAEQQILPITLSGQIGCFTCHDPHNGAKGPKLRVESKEQLCILCHPDRSKVIKEYIKNNPKNKPAPKP